MYGYPRQGRNRELKKAIEGYWKGLVTADALRATAADLRTANWRQLAEAGIDEVPTGDFSYDDHVLDTTIMVGAIPERHRDAVAGDALDGYFAMARGTQDVAPLEMTKWFDTNYHYLVPELAPDTVFTADSAKQVAELKEALALGLTPRPVLVGPITYLLLAKPAFGVAAGFDPLTLLDRLLPAYAEVLADLRAAGAEWVQFDEPALVQDRTPAELNAAERAHLGLPLRPTTTTGSFPQTAQLRTARADLRAGRIDTAAYEHRIKAEIQEVITFQETAGLDVLVHGEPERNDMVQYFAEQLTGYLATQHGWVQSYGTRYVRPPILVGDISRPEPMTVPWADHSTKQQAKPCAAILERYGPGRPSTGRVVRSMDEWHVVLPGRMPAYLTPERYETNLARMEANRQIAAVAGAACTGSALLAGLLRCGLCGGHRMTVSYHSPASPFPSHNYHCGYLRASYGTGQLCQHIAGPALDAYVVDQVMAAIAPAALEVSLRAAEQAEAERTALDRLWQQRLERARYTADPARRQYQLADNDGPGGRHADCLPGPGAGRGSRSGIDRCPAGRRRGPELFHEPTTVGRVRMLGTKAPLASVRYIRHHLDR